MEEEQSVVRTENATGGWWVVVKGSIPRGKGVQAIDKWDWRPSFTVTAQAPRVRIGGSSLVRRGPTRPV